MLRNHALQIDIYLLTYLFIWASLPYVLWQTNYRSECDFGNIWRKPSTLKAIFGWEKLSTNVTSSRSLMQYAVVYSSRFYRVVQKQKRAKFNSPSFCNRSPCHHVTFHRNTQQKSLSKQRISFVSGLNILWQTAGSRYMWSLTSPCMQTCHLWQPKIESGDEDFVNWKKTGLIDWLIE